MTQFQGVAASPGIVIGRVLIHNRRPIRISERKAENEKEELQRFHRALELTKQQINELVDKTKREIGEPESRIFEAHLFILEDPSLVDEITQKIGHEGTIAEEAVSTTIKRISELFREMNESAFKTKANDIIDIGNRLLENILEKEDIPTSVNDKGLILVAEDLTPSDTAKLDKTKILGFATDRGGISSHTSILARASRIPAVVGLGDITKKAKSGAPILLDGSEGIVIIEPSDEIISRYKKRQGEHELVQNKVRINVISPAVTLDGKRIDVAANIGSLEEVDLAFSHGADGIGVFRTEFSYLRNRSLPSEEELFNTYSTVAIKANGKPVTIRTLDMGGEKNLPFFDVPYEENPSLGLRGIRLSLNNIDILKTQIRAFLRASVHCNLRLMFPMISTTEEVQQAKKILNEAKRELKSKGVSFNREVDVGVMIETPSAALTSDLLAKEIDFFSIGTNDLIQYTLAVDRTNPKVTNLYESLHPAILRLLKQTIDEGHKAKIRIDVCGEMAGDLSSIPILVGLDVDGLSMSAFSIPNAKAMIGRMRYTECRKIAYYTLKLKTGRQVREYAEKSISNLLKKNP